MRDDDQRAVVILQRLGQRLAHLDVEVVGRLVEDQQVGLLPHQQREREPRLFAAGKAADRRARHVAAKIEAAEEIAQLLLARARLDLARDATAATRRGATARPDAARSSRSSAPARSAARPRAARAFRRSLSAASTCRRRCGRAGRCARRRGSTIRDAGEDRRRRRRIAVAQRHAARGARAAAPRSASPRK